METRWLYVTSEELPALREASGKVCLIPMGCVEKHGLHLPLGQDIMQSSHISYLASQLETVTVFPDFIFGDVCGRVPYNPVGDITLPLETLVLLLEQLCEQISLNGYDKILLYNGHGGNVAWLNAFNRNLCNKKRSYVFAWVNCLLPAPHGLAETLIKNGRGSIPELTPEDEEILIRCHESNMVTGHACFGETAYMMGIAPETVHLDRLGIESGLSTGMSKKFADAGIIPLDYGWELDYPNAYAGHDPYECNERIGRAALRVEAERLANAIKVYKEDTLLLEEVKKMQKAWEEK